MEVDKFQKEIIEFMKMWEKKRGFPDSEQTTFNHIVEEVGELAREFVSRDIRKDKFSDEKLDNAIGDSLIHLIALAELRGIKVEKLIMDIIDEDKKRVL
ncbi:MazG-like family protein [Candidatus Woesearchaeota archaeon]|nr:MazG-like family protein [Candidatus Woesearchaeota archaeon]